jgi:hypothetical protein
MADIGEETREIEIWPDEEPVPSVVPVELPEPAERPAVPALS